MRIICATITQHSTSTGIAKARSSWPTDSMSLTKDSAGSQRSWTANTSTASVATRNSGTDTTATAVVEAARSNHEPRHTAEAMPSVSAIGTENSAVTAASSSELGSRLATSSATGICVVAERPGSPVTMPSSQLHVALGRRHVQAHLRAQRGQRLGRGVLAELLLRGIAGQHRGDREDDHRHRQQRQQRQRDALGEQLQDA